MIVNVSASVLMIANVAVKMEKSVIVLKSAVPAVAVRTKVKLNLN